MKIKDLFEMAFSVGEFPEYSETQLNSAIEHLLSTGKKLQTVSKTLELWKSDNFYFLVKEKNVLGWLKLSSVKIKSKKFNHVDVLYIIPKYRRGTSTYWLFYSVKQLKPPLIADGAIFKDGVDFIKTIEQHKVNSVKVLNKNSGKISPFDIINDKELCYLFEKIDIKFGANLLPGSSQIDTYFPLFEDPI